MLFKEINNDI